MNATTPQMVRTGRIVRVSDGHLIVRVERPSACHGCRAASMCTGRAPARELLVERPVGSRHCAGDTVAVGIDEDTAVFAALAAYLPPLAGFLLAMLAAVASGLPDEAVAAASLGGTTAGFVALRRLARRSRFQRRPVLHEVGARKPDQEIAS
jgi:positive regulator of sigma E activity